MTQRLKHCGAFLFAALAAASPHASTGTGKIAQVASYRSPAVVFVALDTRPTPLASCGINQSWAYVFPMSTDQDKKIFAMLLEAHATGRTVTITGTGACADFEGIETGTYIVND